jgi:hypothetical protein
VVEEFSLGVIVVGVFVTLSIEAKSQKSISNGGLEGSKYFV